jgi:hypothetical protein
MLALEMGERPRRTPRGTAVATAHRNGSLFAIVGPDVARPGI